MSKWSPPMLEYVGSCFTVVVLFFTLTVSGMGLNGLIPMERVIPPILCAWAGSVLNSHLWLRWLGILLPNRLKNTHVGPGALFLLPVQSFLYILQDSSRVNAGWLVHGLAHYQMMFEHPLCQARCWGSLVAPVWEGHTIQMEKQEKSVPSGQIYMGHEVTFWGWVLCVYFEWFPVGPAGSPLFTEDVDQVKRIGLNKPAIVSQKCQPQDALLLCSLALFSWLNTHLDAWYLNIGCGDGKSEMLGLRCPLSLCQHMQVTALLDLSDLT